MQKTVLLNTKNGACIEMDRLSEELFEYMKLNSPSKEDIKIYAMKKGIEENNIDELYNCLMELEFIYET